MHKNNRAEILGTFKWNNAGCVLRKCRLKENFQAAGLPRTSHLPGGELCKAGVEPLWGVAEAQVQTLVSNFHRIKLKGLLVPVQQSN